MPGPPKNPAVCDLLVATRRWVATTTSQTADLTGLRVGYFQRVDSRKPKMIRPKPIPMFQTPMEPIG
jgi:hypothetical protein